MTPRRFVVLMAASLVSIGGMLAAVLMVVLDRWAMRGAW